MLTVKENTTLVGVSELRTRIDEILKSAKTSKVLIEKRNKLVAVLMDIETYKRWEKVMDELEDVALGYLAKERDSRSKSSDYVGIEEVQKRLAKK